MRRWDVVVGLSGAVAVLAFAYLIAVMVDPAMNGSAVALAGLLAGILGIVFGVLGMSREVADNDGAVDADAFSLDGRLDVYRQLQRVRSRNQEP